ncbi:metal-sulfur cluster assembly factor [Propionibacterium freudenreichii]|nr:MULTISPECIES: metal-sulfur cluster assembly factor [Actinomycetes]ARO13208.1 metal-sulfur cluster biosynthetic enzyme [Propionibacterium freudenreichii]MDN5980014.1 metal-sulfur cluster assembly factor [Bifidobacterium mongoliense]WGU91528.1 metal-sulfur cluster assembly factor [Propionibacterium freudenreichii]
MPEVSTTPTDPNLKPPTEEQVLEALREVVDPELMVNIVDLGLVYGVDIDEHANVLLDMTLTSPTCPLTDQLEWGAQAALDGIANEVTINWVWLPPWSLDRITDDGREQLRYIGFNV